MNLQQIGDEWIEASETLASDTNKRLACVTRFDGNGNAVTRFVIHIKGQAKPTTYEKFDAAAAAYNRLP